MGLKSPLDIKYILGILVIQMLLGFVSTFLSNQLLMKSDSININVLILTIIICNLDKPILKLIKLWLSPESNRERRMISERIANWVLTVFNESDYRWKRDNPDNTQSEAIETIFHIYISISWNIANIITSLIDTIIFNTIAFYNYWLIGLVIICGSFMMYKIRQCYNYKLKKVDLEIASVCKKIRLVNSNQYTNRTDCLVNPLIQNIMKPTQYNPVYGHSDVITVWDSRDRLNDIQQLANEISKSILIILLNLYMINNQKMVIWILINSSKLFGFIDIISNLDQINNLSSCKITPHLKIIDELNLEIKQHANLLDIENQLLISKRLDFESDSFKNYDFEIFQNFDHQHSAHKITPITPRYLSEIDCSYNQIHNIKIDRINWNISNDLNLRSLTPIKINLDENGIIILNGPKGCGKSLTMDILAGQYDGAVCNNSMFINGNYVANEFKSTYFTTNRFYVQQLVSDRYRNNKINSIAMTLRELFPGSSYIEIRDYLVNFDIVKKISFESSNLADSNDLLDIVLGKNERSFSPGELQAIVLASQLYKAFKLNSKMLLLDEPERNIDYETVQKIFDNVISKYQGTIIMITHNDTLKQYLKHKGLIKQVWQFESVGNELMFRT
jgi:ABC-type multidrug transport system fused ATPase/permease subunit